MSSSQIRDPLDRLVTRREAHLIAVHVLQQFLKDAAEEQAKADAAAAEQAARVRTGG